MFWALAFVVAVIGIIVGLWFLQRFYAKATLETALVRTGLGGRRVVLDGGCVALPILHRVQNVSMQVAAVSAARKGGEAVLTRDQLRADVEMEFELCVAPDAESIAMAAQTMGTRIARSGEAIADVLAGPLADAIQAAAAERSLEEIHLNRTEFARDVAASVQARGNRLGLSLVSASLVAVDQSNLAQMDESNAFNARGMRRLAELIAEERKARVAVETGAEVAVREHRLTQHQRQLDLQRAEREAEIAQSEHLSKLEAEADARAEQARAEAKRAAESTRIEQERQVKAAQVANDEALRLAEMEALLALEQSRIDHDIALAEKRAEESAAKAAEEQARAQVILAAEQVQAQKDRAVAERDAEIAALKQARALERETAQINSDVDTLLTRAQAEASARAAAAEAEKAAMEAEAAGRVALNAAENTLSSAVIAMRLEQHKLDRMPEIMTQMMKPVEKIDSIKINHIGGVGAGSMQAAGEGTDGAFGTAMDQILSMAVRLPAMKQMGEEIGLDFDPNIAGRTADYANRIKPKDTKPKE
ncbi:SPFH domain-containing protein [Shimia sp. CNT1-13L.2]|uniref:flotillin domain-containing protein n=1 Tax=Shimia sp. CNT1-13L.2 TaxID=2959663 RepID=UPI0020CF6F47|nr:flotillin domain-containing protein [Shimia sp. CNT1-13L.2]MCP9483331.1 SPFH domain-containing protein [Shimia sp. CNT1-13L.2]